MSQQSLLILALIGVTSLAFLCPVGGEKLSQEQLTAFATNSKVEPTNESNQVKSELEAMANQLKSKRNRVLNMFNGGNQATGYKKPLAKAGNTANLVQQFQQQAEESASDRPAIVEAKNEDKITKIIDGVQAKRRQAIDFFNQQIDSVVKTKTDQQLERPIKPKRGNIAEYFNSLVKKPKDPSVFIPVPGQKAAALDWMKPSKAHSVDRYHTPGK